MTRPANTAAFAKATGRSWEQWLTFLEAIGARDLPHQEIAQRIFDTGDASGWWSQGIAVAYEQHIGRRQPGQRTDGAFEVSVSRTVTGTLDDALAMWIDVMAGRDDVDGVALVGEPGVSRSDKWRYWRCALADGSRVTVTIGGKGEGKAAITVAQQKLDSAEDQQRWRAWWKGVLGGLR